MLRTLLMTTAGLGLVTSGVADAQRVVRQGPAMRAAPVMRAPMARPAPVAHPQPVRPGNGAGWGNGHGPTRPMPHPGNGGGGWHGPRPTPGHGWNGGAHRPPRWGAHHQGRWWGGWRAPGGWGAYRRPLRGWVLPSYWIAPSWYVNDWGSYGLPAPPTGYNWSRYYDDAVLIDGRGSVYDTVGGVNWDGVDDAGTDYDYDDDGSDGGQGDYGDGGDAGPPTAPGAGYDYPQGGGYRPAPRQPVQGAGAPVVVQSGGHYANGYYYPGGSVTTITVSSQPVVTTKTTEIVEDSVTYTRVPAKRPWKKKWRPAPKCVCR